MAPDPMQGELLKAVLGLGLVFGALSGLLWLVQVLRLRYWRKRQITADDRRRVENRWLAERARKQVLAEDELMRGVMQKPDQHVPRWVLSPLDAAMFVEHIARQRAEIETARTFESNDPFVGKGGASGGAGASGVWGPSDEDAAKPVASEPGTIDTARVTEHTGNVGNHPDCCEP